MKSTIVYKQNDSYTLKADIYATSRQNAPVVIYIHGGGLLWGTREEISEEMIQLYTQNGFTLISIDYRLAPETKLPGILEDIQDAIQWVISEGSKYSSINSERIAVVGSSAGGFLALCTGTFKNKPKAIVSFYGYGDISAKWATTPSIFYSQKETVPKEIAKKLITKQVITVGSVEDRFLLYLYARQTGDWIREITGLDPQMNYEKIVDFSPIHNITDEYPPTLLLHGTNDVDVPYEQSAYMRAALLKKGIETKLITIANGEHVFDKDFHNPVVQNAFMQVIEFLQGHLD